MRLNQLQALRERAGLTQAALAQRSGVTQGKISDYETGKTIPRLDSAMKLAAALNVPLEMLIDTKVS